MAEVELGAGTGSAEVVRVVEVVCIGLEAVEGGRREAAEDEVEVVLNRVCMYEEDETEADGGGAAEEVVVVVVAGRGRAGGSGEAGSGESGSAAEYVMLEGCSGDANLSHIDHNTSIEHESKASLLMGCGGSHTISSCFARAAALQAPAL